MPTVNIQTPNWLQQMQAILEELNEGVVIADDELRIVFANEALLRLGRYQRSEIRGALRTRYSRQKTCRTLTSNMN